MTRRLGTSLATSLLALIGLALSACQTTPEVLTLEDAVADPSALRLPFTLDSSGLIHVSADIDGEGPFTLLVDTGATRTSIYRHVAKRLGLETTGAARVHGLVGEEVHGIVSVDSLALAGHDLGPQSVVVLPPRPDTDTHGILGMDVLEGHRVYLSADTRELVLLNASAPAPVLPGDWSRVQLAGNPWGRDSKGLRFLQMRVNGHLAPALLDTGSSISVMSYEFADWPEVRNARRRMRENWELNGALETFRPRVQVKGVDLRAGNRVWFDEDFIIKDLDTLEVIGARGEAFAIAGVNLLDEGNFYLDFAENLLVLPQVPDPRWTSETGSRTGMSAASVTRIELATRNRSSPPVSP